MDADLRRSLQFMNPEISRQISKQYLLIEEIELQILELELLDLKTREDKAEDELWGFDYSVEVGNLMDELKIQIGIVESEIEDKKEEIQRSKEELEDLEAAML